MKSDVRRGDGPPRSEVSRRIVRLAARDLRAEEERQAAADEEEMRCSRAPGRSPCAGECVNDACGRACVAGMIEYAEHDEMPSCSTAETASTRIAGNVPSRTERDDRDREDDLEHGRQGSIPGKTTASIS